MSKPNDCGVYMECRTIQLPTNKKFNKVTVKIAQDDTDGLYRYGVDVMGKDWGSCYGASIHSTGYQTEYEVIGEAIKSILNSYEDYKEVLVKSEFKEYIISEIEISLF